MSVRGNPVYNKHTVFLFLSSYFGGEGEIGPRPSGGREGGWQGIALREYVNRAFYISV